MALAAVSLDDRYDLDRNEVLLSGTQAVVRLLLMQRERDRRAGFDTAAYVSGYRGSPLGSLDQQLWRAEKALQQAGVVFNPGINEELAATALWGSQQAELRGDGRFDGVFGLWYGKGPGVDRAGDALRHANLAGTSARGGVLALMGDDHTCESSTTAHQSEYAFVDAMIPILSPAGVQEILDFGLIGYALSRYAGTWVGLKCVKDTVESTSTVDGTVERVATLTPASFRLPPGGLNIRTHDSPLAQEERLHEQKIPAVLAFLRANVQDRIVRTGGHSPRIGIVTAGKSYLDVLQALDDLGIDEAAAAALGLRVLKLACTWPVEPETLREFAEGLRTIIVVEEKRGLIEGQIREILYGRADPPVIIGKKDEASAWLFPSKGALDSNIIAIAIGERLVAAGADERLQARVAALREAQAVLVAGEDIAVRTPYFCAGCPYNTATKVPEGSRAYAGIGCHYMVQRVPDRATEGYTQMGAEGANWIGEAPFSTRGHVFQNVGDGTYVHSGSLVVRAAIAAGTTMTFKILFNDAVALTGGQKPDGNVTVEAISAQMLAEGVARVAVVSEEPARYGRRPKLPAGTLLSHRDNLDDVQKRLAAIPGVTVLIYDQTCAAEKRRRRKRGQYPDPGKRVVINERVCEGCGDCGIQSNCVAIVPKETEFGRKRAIDQSVCNKDFSCLKGFCPSFVTMHGAAPKAPAPALADDFRLPDPRPPTLHGDYAILVTGVGGTGVVTIGALLTMAAHMEGKAAAAIDMAGLAQKGGPVTSHVRIAPAPEAIKAIRVAAGGADTVLACDMVVASSAGALAAIAPGHTRVFVNTHETYPGAFTHDPDYTLPTRRIVRAIEERAGGGARVIEATEIATRLMGDAIAANVFMLGLAVQAGAIPVSPAAILAAIALNGVSVEMNRAAFAWGRRAAIEPDVVAAIAARHAGQGAPPIVEEGLDAIVARRTDFLTGYQDEAYARRFADKVARIADAEAAVLPGQTELAQAVAGNLFKLMAIKDEYEVARLFTDGIFADQLGENFAGWKKLEFHMAPPLFGKRDKATGQLVKKTYGPWLMPVLRRLAAMRRVRGTWRDPFGYSAERRMERQLLANYEATLDIVVERLAADNHEAAVALVRYPEMIRGFGHVKAASVRRALPEAAARRAAFLAREPAYAAAE